MSLGPPINRPQPPSREEAANTWTSVPGKPWLERNGETPPKLRTKDALAQPVWPPGTWPPKAAAAPDVIVIDEGAQDGDQSWGIIAGDDGQWVVTP